MAMQSGFIKRIRDIMRMDAVSTAMRRESSRWYGCFS